MHITDRRAAHVAGVRILLVAGLLGAVASASVFLGNGTSRAAARLAKPAVQSATAGANTTPKVRRKGILVLAGNGTAYDLDSRVADWDPSVGKPWVDQNIEYVPQWKGSTPVLFIAGEPTTDVLMGPRGHWTYQDCADALYNPSFGASNPNTAAGSALNVGHGICVITEDTDKPDSKKPLKTDGGHYVLLVVKARTGSTLTLQVTVWQ
jgi:hypothetical protein